MADIDIAEEIPLPAQQRPPVVTSGVIGWLRANLFNSVVNTLLTILAVYLLVLTVPPLIRWMFIDAIWSAPNGQACRGEGACWAFIGEKWRFIFFGRFPYDAQWRPLFVMVIIIGLILASCDRRLWGRRLILLWPAGLVAVGILMSGGVFGLRYVPSEYWSGLPLTLILAVVGMLFAFPFAILLALGRRTRLIVLPQALAMVIPPLVNNFIGAFKNTSLVLIIGLFDLLNTANTALTDANWQGFASEAYIFVAAIYFCFCFFMSRYSQRLGRSLNRGHRR